MFLSPWQNVATLCSSPVGWATIMTGPRQYTAWPLSAKYHEPPLRCCCADGRSTGMRGAGATRNAGRERNSTTTARAFMGLPGPPGANVLTYIEIRVLRSSAVSDVSVGGLCGAGRRILPLWPRLAD